MKICLLMEPPRSKTSVTFDVVAGLERGSIDLKIVTERSGLIDLERFPFDHDLYLFKSQSPLAESIEALRPVVREMPIVVKPYRGRRGVGIDVCMDEVEFDAVSHRIAGAARAAEGDDVAGGGEDGSALGDRLVFAQAYEEHEPFDYKAYAIGGFIHAIKRVLSGDDKRGEGGYAGRRLHRAWRPRPPVRDALTCLWLLNGMRRGGSLSAAPAAAQLLAVTHFPVQLGNNPDVRGRQASDLDLQRVACTTSIRSCGRHGEGRFKSAASSK